MVLLWILKWLLPTGSLTHGGDISMIFSWSLQKVRSDRLKIFVDYLNNIHPTIKFSSSHSLTGVPFLDIMMSLHNSIIETDLSTKRTDKHQYLLSSSCYTHHTKKAIPLSLALRLSRICSTDAKFKHRINELKTYLLARGHNNNFLEGQFLHVANISRTNALQTKPTDSITMLYHLLSHI